MLVSFIEQIGGGRGSEVKSHRFCKISPDLASIGEGDVLISSFLQPFTTEQRHFSFTFRQTGRVPRGEPLCVVIITKARESKG